MRLPRSIEGRLTIVYAAGLFAGLCAFAVISAFFLVQLSNAVLDAKLRATATAVTAIAADSGASLSMDPGDTAQFARVVTSRMAAAILRPDRSVVIASASQVPPEVLASAAQSQTGIALRSVRAKAEALRVAGGPVVVGGVAIGSVLVWASTEPIADFERLLTVVFGVSIPVIVVVAIGSARYIARRGLEPLRDIARLATDIEAHDLSRRLRPASEADELGGLAATFDRMLDRLQAAFERQRRFTGDASHELRAPLSIIRAEADLALQRSRDEPAYRKALESIADEADRLEALIVDLLSAARAETEQGAQTAIVDWTPIVARCAERLDAVASARGVRIETRLDAEAHVRGVASELDRVALALLDNAVKYASAGGSVAVDLSDVDGVVRLAVRDDGPGFSEEGLRRATDRFWRDDRVRGRSGSGLGLSLVRAIVERGGGSVELRNATNGGAVVTVLLPAPA